jgi:hypothetical protein
MNLFKLLARLGGDNTERSNKPLFVRIGILLFDYPHIYPPSAWVCQKGEYNKAASSPLSLSTHKSQQRPERIFSLIEVGKNIEFFDQMIRFAC